MPKEIIPLIETYYSKLDIVESKSENLRPGVLATVIGPFAQYGTRNRNNRVYPKSLWEKVINSDYVQEQLKNRTLFGEADHPKDRFEVSLPDVSHSVTKLWLDEKNKLVMGEADILDTPAGRVIHTLVKYGSKVGISSRAAGSVTKTDEGFNLVNEDDFTFFAFDCVANPGFEVSRLEAAPTRESVDYKAIKESLLEQVNNCSPENLKVVEKVLKSSGTNYYDELIDRIEERKKSFKSSEQENTLSLLEEAYRKAFELENENKKLKETLQNLEGEVNGLSEVDEEYRSLRESKKVLSAELEISELELREAKERIQSLEAYVHSLKKRLDSSSKVKSLEERVEVLREESLSLQETIRTLTRKAKSKDMYAQAVEERVNKVKEELESVKERNLDLEREKVKLEDKASQLTERVSMLESERTSLQETVDYLTNEIKKYKDFVIRTISGRTGADEELVRGYIKEGFNLSDVPRIERKIKDIIGRNIFESGYSSPIDLDDTSLNEGSDFSDPHNQRLVRLIKNIRSK